MIKLFITVVPAILARNERHSNWFRNSVSLACWT